MSRQTTKSIVKRLAANEGLGLVKVPRNMIELPDAAALCRDLPKELDIPLFDKKS